MTTETIDDDRLDRRVGRTARQLWRIAAMASVAVIAIGSAAEPAAAYTHSWAGSPGGVTPYQYVGQAVYTQTSSGVRTKEPGVHVPGPTISRSPAAAGTQYVTYVAKLEAWSGSQWITANTLIRRYTIGSSTSSIRAESWFPTWRGYVRVTLGVSWHDAFGRLLGSRAIFMHQRGDYRCNTGGLILCNDGANGYLWIG